MSIRVENFKEDKWVVEASWPNACEEQATRCFHATVARGRRPLRLTRRTNRKGTVLGKTEVMEIVLG